LIVRTLEIPFVQTRLLTMSNNSSAKVDRCFAGAVLLCASIAWTPMLAQVPDIRGGQIPTLAPMVKETTPSVVNISVHARVKEDNPLYRDPVFREFFDLPKQLEKEVQATGSGVIVDAERGYVLTANHVVAQISKAQVTTKDGRKFDAKLVGRDPAISFKDQEVTSRPSRWVTATGSRSAIS
jgi:serine protease Do